MGTYFTNPIFTVHCGYDIKRLSRNSLIIDHSAFYARTGEFSMNLSDLKHQGPAHMHGAF
jgi:hypothetical protein